MVMLGCRCHQSGAGCACHTTSEPTNLDCIVDGRANYDNVRHDARMTPVDARARSTNSLNIRLTLIGMLLLLAFASLFAAAFLRVSMLGSVTSFLAYALLLIVLWKSSPYPMALIFAGMAGGSRSGLIVGGLGGLIGLEISRLAGSGWEFSFWSYVMILFAGAMFGMYLAMGLSALVVAGVNRRWLLALSMMLVPAVPILTEPWLRTLLASGVATLNYAMVALICGGFGTVAFPIMRSTYWREVNDQKEREEREHRRAEKEKEEPKDPATKNAGDAANKVAKQRANEQIAQELKGVGVRSRAEVIGLRCLLWECCFTWRAPAAIMKYPKSRVCPADHLPADTSRAR